MSNGLPNAPLYAGLAPREHFAKATSFDAALVAMEQVILAGFAENDVRAMQAAMMHAYTMRIGVIIAGCDPADRDSLLDIAQEQIADAADVFRTLRS